MNLRPSTETNNQLVKLVSPALDEDFAALDPLRMRERASFARARLQILPP